MATYYINADTGVNSGAGGSGAPWLTLAYAITNSTTNDTIVFQHATATYAFGTQNVGVRNLQAAILGDAVLDGAAGNVQWTWGSGTSTITNLIFQNIVRTTVSSGNAIMNTAGGTALATFTNCIFRSITVSSGGNTPNSLISGAGNTTLIGCLFDAFTAGGASVQPGYFGSSDSGGVITVTNCTFHNTALGTGIVAFIGRLTGATTMVLKNNIVYQSIAGTWQSFGTVPTYTGSATNCSFGPASVPAGAAVTVTSDPLFVDATNANFNLRPTSPCIDTGSL